MLLEFRLVDHDGAKRSCRRFDRSRYSGWRCGYLGPAFVPQKLGGRRFDVPGIHHGRLFGVGQCQRTLAQLVDASRVALCFVTKLAQCVRREDVVRAPAGLRYLRPDVFDLFIGIERLKPGEDAGSLTQRGQFRRLQSRI